MPATSKNVSFPGHNHLLTTSTDDPALWLLPEHQRVKGHQYWWLAGGYGFEIGAFLEMACMVVTWWIVAFFVQWWTPWDRHMQYINSYSASHDNWCTGTLWNRIITAQCEGMGEVGSARYEPALLPPCPSIRVLCYSNCQRSTQSHQQSMGKYWRLQHPIYGSSI